MTRNLLTNTAEAEQAHLVQRAENLIENISTYADEGNVSAFKSLKNRYAILATSMEEYGISKAIISNYDTRIKLFSIKMRVKKPRA